MKTVKDILREARGIKYQGDSASELLRKISIEITKAYEEEIEELKKQILYKEDFKQSGGLLYKRKFIPIYTLKDNSKYDKLDSKESKND